MRILILLSVLTLFACGGGADERTLESIEGDGINRAYFENGRLKYIGKYNSRTGHRTGLWKSYYENGQLAQVGEFNGDTGHRIGKWRFYCFGGNLDEIGEFNSAGEKTGIWKERQSCIAYTMSSKDYDK